MTEAKQLISWFWSEYNRQKEHTGYRHSIAFTTAPDGEGFCQCGSEKFIDGSDNPKRMRAFLMIGVTIDQMMPTYYSDLYYEFVSEYKYPKLHAHSGGGTASSSWFSYSYHGYDMRVDWEEVDFVAGILLKDLSKWLRGRGYSSSDVEKFVNTLSSQVSNHRN